MDLMNISKIIKEWYYEKFKLNKFEVLDSQISWKTQPTKTGTTQRNRKFT